MEIKNKTTQELPEKSNRLLSRQDVAELLGVHSGTVKRYQHSGLIPAIVINSRLVRYRYNDVQNFIEGGNVELVPILGNFHG